MGIIEWHKNYTRWLQNKLGISDYTFLWLSFFKGVVVTLFILLTLRAFDLSITKYLF